MYNKKYTYANKYEIFCTIQKNIVPLQPILRKYARVK